ncbi:MAG TPA: hypothetical protein VHL57_09090, partial [Flavobacteriales bacterium]|nr:hypothetical protein [Flavobacteriales bacterium]
MKTRSFLRVAALTAPLIAIGLWAGCGKSEQAVPASTPEVGTEGSNGVAKLGENPFIRLSAGPVV